MYSGNFKLKVSTLKCIKHINFYLEMKQNTYFFISIYPCMSGNCEVMFSWNGYSQILIYLKYLIFSIICKDCLNNRRQWNCHEAKGHSDFIYF